MKRTLTTVCALLLALCMVLPVYALPAGTYEGIAQGYGGEVKAIVTLSEDKLENLEVSGGKETPGLGAVAIEQLPSKMLQMQDVDIDALTGATITSGAIEQAIAAALASAGITPDDVVTTLNLRSADVSGRSR